MASLQAKFDRFTLHNLLRYLATSAATGRLTIQSNNGHETQVFFERGKVVHHDMPEAGVAGMTELLTWQKGTFYFEDGQSAPRKTLRLFLDNVLPNEEVPSSSNAEVSTLGVILRPSTVLSTEGNMDLATGTIALDVFAIELLMHFDGKRTLREVAEIVSKPLEQVISESRLLLAKGIAQSVDDATPKPHQHTPSETPTKTPAEPPPAPPPARQDSRQQRQPRERPAAPPPAAQPPASQPPANQPPANQSTRPADNNPAKHDDDLADFARNLTRGSATSSQTSASPAAGAYVNPAFLDDFTQLAQEKLGPVAAMLIEDVLLDIESSPTTLTANHIEQLIDEVDANITRQDWQEDFRSSVAALRTSYGV
jgi:hypothetical protein